MSNSHIYAQYIETGECTYMYAWPEGCWILNATMAWDESVMNIRYHIFYCKNMNIFIEEDNPILHVKSIYDLKIV